MCLVNFDSSRIELFALFGSESLIFKVRETVEVIMVDGANEAIEVVGFTQDLEFNNLI